MTRTIRKYIWRGIFPAVRCAVIGAAILMGTTGLPCFRFWPGAEAWAQTGTTPADGSRDTTAAPGTEKQDAPVESPPVSVITGTSPSELKASTVPRKQEELTLVDIVHGGISRSILSTATWLDSFFGDRRYASELNTSYVRFGYNVFLEKGSRPLLKPDVQVRVVLPQLREKTHLVISGVPKEENEFSPVQSKSTTESDQFADNKDRGVTTSLNYVPLQTVEQSFTVRGGLKLHHASPVILIGPRYRVLFPFENGWSLRCIEELTWRNDNGWYSRSTVDLERPLPRNLFFRTSTDWVHTEHVQGYLYSLSFAVLQPLTLRRALEYEWINIFQTDPVNELAEIDLRVHFRRRIWRNWLYFDVVPQYRFPRPQRFDAIPGILFRFELIFGSYV